MGAMYIMGVGSNAMDLGGGGGGALTAPDRGLPTFGYTLKGLSLIYPFYPLFFFLGICASFEDLYSGS